MKNQNTYSMLINSRDKGRDLFEAAVYTLVGLSAVTMFGYGAMQSDSVRAHASVKQAPAAPMVAKTIVAQPLATGL